MPHKTERATLPNTELRVVTAADGTRTVSGLIPYNAKSVDLGGFTELIAPGAFAAAILPDADVLALRDHNSSALLGRTKSGTLSLTLHRSDSLSLKTNGRQQPMKSSELSSALSCWKSHHAHSLLTRTLLCLSAARRKRFRTVSKPLHLLK
jgi:hypothetical protein